MIDIKIFIKPKYFSMRIVGHAAYNPGNDIICAAVSTISQTFQRLYSEMGYSGTEDSGYSEVNGELTDDIKPLLKFAITGYEGLANAYPDNVSLSIADEDKVLYK